MFDTVDTEGENNTVVFWYTLENTTDWDYRLTEKDSLHLMGSLKKQGSLSTSREAFETFDLPVYLPARLKIRYGIHVAYPYNEKLATDASADEKKAFKRRLFAWLNSELGNLNGFVLFDDER